MPFPRIVMAQIISALLIASCCWGDDPEEPSWDYLDTPCIHISEFNFDFSSDSGRDDILIVWPDGFMIWSENPIDGSDINRSNFRAGDVAQEKIAEVMESLEADGYFDKENIDRLGFWAQSPFMGLKVRSKGKELRIATSHELFNSSGKTWFRDAEGNDKKIVLPRLEALGRVPESELRKWLAWSELRQRLTSLILVAKPRTNGKVVLDKGKVRWKEHDNEGPTNEVSNP